MHRIILYAATLVPVVGCSSKSSDTTSEATEDSAMVNIDLADDTFKRILKKHGEDVDPSKIPKPQQTVMLVYHSYGILGNAAFSISSRATFLVIPNFYSLGKLIRRLVRQTRRPLSRRRLQSFRIQRRRRILIAGSKCGNRNTTFSIP